MSAPYLGDKMLFLLCREADLKDAVQGVQEALNFTGNFFITVLIVAYPACITLKDKTASGTSRLFLSCQNLRFSLPSYALRECFHRSHLWLKYCVVLWKSYYERFHFNPLKCMAGVNVQCKKDWCVEI
jgi:hypothetical protein